MPAKRSAMKKWLRSLVFMALAGLALGVLLTRCVVVNVPLGSFLGWDYEVPPEKVLRERIRLPQGFSFSLYATDLPGARLLRFTDTGDLLVSLPRSGRIVLLERDADGDGQPDGRYDLLSGLNRPHGMDLWDGWLYVAEADAIGRILFDAKGGKVKGQFERIAALPGGGFHQSRTLRFGPDGGLYASVGSSCNVCEEKDPRRAALLRFPVEGGQGEIYASGLRNTVGFAWRPGTEELYGVDNGRDLLGDNFPPDELNVIERGQFYGWPYASGNKVADPDLGAGHEEAIRKSIAPVYAFDPHTAPLSIVFLEAEHWPADYRGAVLVALHGSWNSSVKVGYKVVSLHFAKDGKISERPFVTGFEMNEDVIGRPVDVVEGPDGAIYISDDFTGSIYRVTYGMPKS